MFTHIGQTRFARTPIGAFFCNLHTYDEFDNTFFQIFLIFFNLTKIWFWLNINTLNW